MCSTETHLKSDAEKEAQRLQVKLLIEALEAGNYDAKPDGELVQGSYHDIPNDLAGIEFFDIRDGLPEE